MSAGVRAALRRIFCNERRSFSDGSDAESKGIELEKSAISKSTDCGNAVRSAGYTGIPNFRNHSDDPEPALFPYRFFRIQGEDHFSRVRELQKAARRERSVFLQIAEGDPLLCGSQRSGDDHLFLPAGAAAQSQYQGARAVQRHFLYAVDHSDRSFLHDLAVPAQSGSRTGEQHSQVAGTVQEHVVVR